MVEKPFSHSAIQPFNHSTIQPFNHSTIQPFNHSTIQPFNHSTILNGCKNNGLDEELVTGDNFTAHLPNFDLCIAFPLFFGCS